MATWLREYGRGNASPHTLGILDKVGTDLACSDRSCLEVTSIRIGAGLKDHHDFEVEVKIAPGITLAVRYQSVDEDDRDENDLEDEGGSVAWLVAQAVKVLQAEGVPTLADWFHNLPPNAAGCH